MSWASIAAAVKAELDTVAGITGGLGKVIIGHPNITRPDVYRTAFKGTGTVNAWTIVRETLIDPQKGDGFRFILQHGVRVRGYLARNLATGSEATFDAIVDAVDETLRGKTSIWVVQPESEPITVNMRFDSDRLGDVLCHFADIRFKVDEIKELTS